MKKRLLPLALALALSGCMNLAPTYERPDRPVAQRWPEGEAYKNSELKRVELPDWEDFFTNEQLKQVIRLALENNRDLRVSALNIERARAKYGIERANLFPTVAARASNVGNNTSIPQVGADRTTHNYTAQLAMSSYELDLFGRVRNMNEAALQDYLRTQDGYRRARNALIREVAMVWMQLGSDKRQLAMQQEVLATQEESFRLMESSYKLGAVSQLDYEQARSILSRARAQIVSYTRAVAQDENALTLLVGSAIPKEQLPNGLDAEVTATNVLPSGLPSEVLLNRPDIMAAERTLVGANALIGAARAAFFPSVSISGGVGSGSAHLSDLFTSGSGIWTFTPNVSLPIFRGGRNLSNLRLSEAQEKIAAATYEKTIQNAFREVADALATVGTVEDELNARMDYETSTRKTYDLTKVRYERGAASYSDLLTAQRAHVAARQALLGTELARAASRVTLFKTLGGGASIELPQSE